MMIWGGGVSIFLPWISNVSEWNPHLKGRVWAASRKNLGFNYQRIKKERERDILILFTKCYMIR